MFKRYELHNHTNHSDAKITCREFFDLMLSDGVALLPDEVPWLLEFLSRPTDKSASDYADELLALALENSKTNDDLTVSVMRVLAA